MGNLNGNLYGMGHYRDNVKKEWQSPKGYYKLAFVETFNKMTARDVEIRQEYAKDLIAAYLSVPKDMIVFRKKSTNTGIASLDEVYYVKVGKSTIGKISIRVQRTFREATLAFIFQEKRIRDVNSPATRKSSGYKGRTKADKRKTNRNSRKGKKKL